MPTLLEPTRSRGASRRLAVSVAVAALAALSIGPATALATFPGRDGRIAFQAQTAVGIQVFTMRREGGGIRQITHVTPREGADTPGAGGPDWSPDGRTLAITVNDCQVGLVSANGGPVTLVPTPAGRTPGVDYCEGDPAFTANGTRLLVDTYDPLIDQESIASIALDGSDRVLVTSAGGPDPNVAPDGSRISFKGPGGALYTAKPDGTDMVRVSPDVDVAYKHDWSPDGSRLVFSDIADPGPTQPVNVWTVRPDGSGPRAVTHFTDPLYRAYVGSYSPDGNWILFRLEDRHRTEVQGIYALYVVRPDGRAMHRITPWSMFLPRALDWGTAPRA
jgi:Tol biopolymer transport system component